MSRRIAIGIHEIGRVMAGEQRFFLRPHSSFFSRVKEGEKLWIAEPFHLEKRYDGYAPTVARDLGAVPAFAADNTFDQRALATTHGRRHAARPAPRGTVALPRVAPRPHRRHQPVRDPDSGPHGRRGCRTRFQHARQLQRPLGQGSAAGRHRPVQGAAQSARDPLWLQTGARADEVRSEAAGEEARASMRAVEASEGSTGRRRCTRTADRCTCAAPCCAPAATSASYPSGTADRASSSTGRDLQHREGRCRLSRRSKA